MNGTNPAMRDRRFFSGIGIGLFLIAFIGFSRSFYLDPILPDVPAPKQPYYYWIHGPVFTLWMALIAFQPWLIRQGNYQLHRQLGLFGVGIAVLVVVTGIWGALLLAAGKAQMMQTGLPPRQGWATPLTSMTTFAILAGVGFWKRQDKALHKRAMVLATIGMMGAPLARWPVIGDWPPTHTRMVLEVIIAVMVVYDLRSLKRLHWITLWGGLLLVISHRLIKPMIWKTQGWENFTDTVVSLAGLG
jgi:uncharacterized membrane protein YozB (DUF420 family)